MLSLHPLPHYNYRLPRNEFTCKTGGPFSVNISHNHLLFPHHPRSFKILCSNGLKSSSASQLVIEDKEKERFYEYEARMNVKELRDCFDSGKTRSYEWRVSQLTGIAKMLDEKENDIFAALQTDLSKPQHESFISEISLSRGSCKLALEELKLWMKPQKVETSLSTFPSSAEIVSEPLGVVLVISTWNYPFLLSLEPVIGAISAGNAVVLKPSEVAPASSSLIAKLFKEYLDNSAVRVIEGAVPETTALLEQKWDKIFYTGSGRVGRIVMLAAAKHLTPVTLELGGKCPAVVDSDVDLEVAARRIIAGKWACNSGQACIAADYVITTRDFAPKLIDALRSELKEFFGEHPLESKDLSRIVNLYHFKRLLKLMREDKVSDMIVLGGQTNEIQLKIAPTIFLDVPLDSLLMEEEIFGPLLPILTVTVPKLPFGGVGESGMGSYHGKFSFDDMSHKKAVLYRTFDGESPARYPPYSPAKLNLLKKLLSGNVFEIVLALLGISNG